MEIQSKQSIHKGVVLWGTKNIFNVLPLEKYTSCIKNNFLVSDVEEHVVECRIKGKRHKDNKKDVKKNESYSGRTIENKTFLTAMDYVEYVYTDENNTQSKSGIKQGLIVKRIERKNYIERKKNTKLHVVAVNLDILGIVLSVANPSFRPRFADRLICIAFEQNITPIVVLNKTDLFSEQSQKNQQQIRDRIDIYKSLGVAVIESSAVNKKGVDTIKKMCQGSVSAFIGQSGVGKSSLVNCLISCARQTTDGISKKYNRGKHITIRPELFLESGMGLVDTPGIRDLYPAEIDTQNILIGYPDIAKFTNNCKLSSCLHYKEPDCAVKKEVGKNIYTDRYQSYIGLLEDILEWEKNKWYRNTL